MKIADTIRETFGVNFSMVIFLPGQILWHGADDTSLEDQDHGYASLSDEPKIQQ
jgi:hypothetical protein